MKKKLNKKYPSLEISERHISRIIRDNNFTRKRLSIKHVPEKRFGKDIDIAKQIKDFYKEIEKYSLKDIVCLDETSIKAGLTFNYGRSEIGKRAVKKTTDNKVFRKYTLLLAISYKGIIGCKLYEKGGVDSNRISEFIKKHITDKYKNKLVILDNAGAHRDKKVKDEITKNNNYLYLVPYQHQLNPIEELFNQLKYYLRLKSPIEFKDIKKVIVYALNKITKENFMNYYKHAFIKSKEVLTKKKNSRRKTSKNYKD